MYMVLNVIFYVTNLCLVCRQQRIRRRAKKRSTARERYECEAQLKSETVAKAS